MNDTLQATETETENNFVIDGPTEDVETNESENNGEGDGEGSESASEEEKKVVFSDDQQAVFNDVIGQKVKATREAERHAENLQRQLDEANAKIPQPERPQVPTMPDFDDDDYDQKLQDRDTAIQKQSEFDTTKRVQTEAQEGRDRVAQAQEQERTTKAGVVFVERSGKMGIAQEDLSAAVVTLAQQGFAGAFGAHLMQDEQGPAIAILLANDPVALDELRGMSPMQAAVHVEMKIKPKLKAKKTTSAPSPAETLEGGGTPPEQRGPKGATYS